MRRLLVAFVSVAILFVAGGNPLLHLPEVAATLPAESGALSAVPLNNNFADGFTNWDPTGGTPMKENAPTYPSNPADGYKDLNFGRFCTGGDGTPGAPAIKLPLSTTITSHEEITIPLDAQRMSFSVAASSGSSVSITLLLPFPTPAEVLFSKSFTSNTAFTTSCPVDSFAGQNATVKLESSAPGTVWYMNVGVTTSMGSFRYQSLSPDPVSLVSGSLSHSNTDLSIPGRGVALDFTRNYDSASATLASDLGYGWRHDWNTRLGIFSEGSVEVRWPSGARPFFTKSGANFTTPSGVFDTLSLSAGVYTLKTADLMRYQFDSSGRLTAMVDRNDNVTTIVYDGSSTRIATITEPAGRQLTFTYDVPNGRITQIADPLGRTVGYGYSGAGDLTSVRAPFRDPLANPETGADCGAAGTGDGDDDDSDQKVDDGCPSSIFAYSSHRLTTIADARGNVQVTNTYDSADRVVRQVDAENGITCFFYGVGPANTQCADHVPVSPTVVAGQTVMVDPRGIQELHQFDKSFRPTGIERKVDGVDLDTIMTYEISGSPCSPSYLNGYRCSVTDPLGNVTSFTYDSKGNVLTQTNDLGEVWTYQYNATTNDLTKVIDPRRDAVCPTGCVTEYIYETAMTSCSTPAADHDNLCSVKDALGKFTTFRYDDAANPGLLTKTTDAVLNETNFVYNSHGYPKDVYDGLGNQTNYCYDAGGRVLQEFSPNRNLILISEAPLPCTSTTTGDGVDTDSDGRIDDGFPSRIMEYDAQNNLTKVTEAFVVGDVSGAPVTTYVYDAVGNRTAMTNARGYTTDYVYDKKNRLKTELQPQIAGEAGGRRTSKYVYDANDNLKEFQDPRRSPTTRKVAFTYDDANRLKVVQYPDIHYKAEYAYDKAGRRTLMTDTRGYCEPAPASCDVGATDVDQTTYVHDDANRLTSVTTDFAGSKTAAYEYDKAGNRTKLTYPDTKFADYTYDANGRMKTVAGSWIPGTTTYNYDDAGRLDTAVLPTSPVVTMDYGYDLASRLTSIVNKKAGSPDISFFTYVLDPSGNRTRMTDIEGMTDYTYDPLERLRTAAYPGQGAITFGYDLGGNRTSVSSPASAYTFDETDQMKTIDSVTNKFERNGNLLYLGSAAPFDHTFLYDQENRLFRTGPCRGDVNGDGAVNPADSGIVATRYGTEGNADGKYDLLADLSADGVINVVDQGIRASENGKQCKSTGANTGNGRYWYNGDGLRVGSRTFSTAAPTRTDTDYVWDAGAGMPVVLQETNDPNNGDPVPTTYLYGLDLIASTVGSGASVFYLSDGLGSTRELVTTSGDVVDNYHYTYDVWGGLRSAQPATMNDFRFTGEQTDVRANRGLVYLRARFYDPALGRFLNRDPLVRLPGWTGQAYAYGKSNPVNIVDPTGLDPDNERTPVAVGLPDDVEDARKQACVDRFDDCISMAHEVQRSRPRPFIKGSIFPLYAICTKYLARCVGNGTYAFEMARARHEMETGEVPMGEGEFFATAWQNVTELVNSGSGGYLSQTKESRFGCAR